MPTIGEMTTTSQLLAMAQNFKPSPAAVPYQKAVVDENDSFIASLQNARQGTLADIQADALQLAQASQKKAMYASVAGMALVVASFVAPIPPAASFLRLGGMIGGFFVSNVIGGKAAQEAAVQQNFARQLQEWEVSLNAQQPAPSQPSHPQPCLIGPDAIGAHA